MHQNKNKLLSKFKQILIVGILLILMSFTIIIASESDKWAPTDEQYLELRAVSVEDVPGQNKQVMMELWVNNIEFKRI